MKRPGNRSLPALAGPALFVSALMAGCGPEARVTEQEGAEEAKATVAAFHAALERGDSTAALELLHPDVRIYEQGHAETFEEYRAGHLAADIDFAREVDREVLREEVIEWGGRAVYLAETSARGEFRGREIDARGVETIALMEVPEGWRIRHIHWSSR